MKRTLLAAALFISTLLSAQDIEGLWIVDLVSMGDMEMTPNARWAQFNSDGTQSSGNGWTKHGVGTYTFEDGKLKISTENATEDTYEPFSVEIEGDSMTWTRTEDGNAITVYLSRIDEAPMAYADEVLGLWELESANGDYADYPELNAKMYLRPDNIIYWSTDNGQQHRGLYRVNAHFRQIEWMPYDESAPRRTFDFHFDEDGKLILETESGIMLVFTRTRQF